MDAWALSEAETVALATDALADRDALQERLRERGRQISRGYVRCPTAAT